MNNPEFYKEKPTMGKLIGGGYFDQFLYYCDDYNWPKHDLRQEKLLHQEKNR